MTNSVVILRAAAVAAMVLASAGALAGGADRAAAAIMVLDELHAAAAAADGERYFAVFAPDSVFLGTAAEERWTLERFRAFVEPYFAAGRGWTYVPRDDARNVNFALGGEIAWFDELLDNDKYGVCRGTGVLRRIDGEWKIAQYSLSIPIPNAIALDVVEMIRAAPPPE